MNKMEINKKKIAVLYAGAHHWGGVETYIENLFKYNDKTVIDLTLVSIGEWELTDRLKGLGFRVQIFDKHWWNVLNILRINSQLKANNIDLIVSQGMVANFYARKTSFLSGIPNLVTVHSDWKRDYKGFKKFIFWISDKLLRFATSRYVCVSEFLKKELINEGIRGEKIQVIYNGVTLNQKSKIKSQKNDSKIIIGSIGRLHPVKNYGELIKTMKELKNCELRIYGSGVEEDALNKLIHELDLSDRVKLSGQTTDIEKTLSDIDIYVQPSLSEGFGLTVVEAMLAGKPVVVTPGGALPELVENGKNGIVTKRFNHNDIAEAIEKYLDNPELMTKCAIEGRKWAQEKFEIGRWIKETEKVYVESSK